MARALALAPSRGQLRRIAVEYQLLGEYGTAIRLLEPMTTAIPPDAEALRDKGVCEGLRGSTATAIGNLEQAVRARPGLLSAHISLGSLYESLGRPDAARRTYQEGLGAGSRLPGARPRRRAPPAEARRVAYERRPRNDP